MAKKKPLQYEDYRVLSLVPVDLLIVTAIKRELDSVLNLMQPLEGRSLVSCTKYGGLTWHVGLFAGHRSAVVQCKATGTALPGSATLTTHKGILVWMPKAVLMTGVAFGKPGGNRQIGTTLISRGVLPYEVETVGDDANDYRGGHLVAGSNLLAKFEAVDYEIALNPDGEKCGIEFGDLLSGNKFFASASKRDQLFSKYDSAIGGEMEGNGVASAAHDLGVEWILIKSICDWADNTSKGYQVFAAATSARVAEYALSSPGFLDGIKRPPRVDFEISGSTDLLNSYEEDIGHINSIVTHRWVTETQAFFSSYPRITPDYILELQALVHNLAPKPQVCKDEFLDLAISNVRDTVSDFIGILAKYSVYENGWIILKPPLWQYSGAEAVENYYNDMDTTLNLGAEVARAVNRLCDVFCKMFPYELTRFSSFCSIITDESTLYNSSQCEVYPRYPDHITSAHPYPGLKLFQTASADRDFWYDNNSEDDELPS